MVTWPPNLIISDTFTGISGPDSDEKLAPNIIDKYSHSSPEDERTVKRPISMGSFVVSQKEPFRSLILSFPFEIDYTTVNSRRSS